MKNKPNISDAREQIRTDIIEELQKTREEGVILRKYKLPHIDKTVFIEMIPFGEKCRFKIPTSKKEFNDVSSLVDFLEGLYIVEYNKFIKQKNELDKLEEEIENIAKRGTLDVHASLKIIELKLKIHELRQQGE